MSAKEILDELQRKNDRYNYCIKEDISFSDDDYEAHLLLDYITNLQERYNALLEAHKITDEMLTEYQNRNDKAIEKNKR